MSAEDFVKLLSVAYNAKHLYPDPKTVPSFIQAVEKLGVLGGTGLAVEVTVDGFRVGSEVLETSHGAAIRLNQLLFSKQIASLALVGAPTADEVLEFFNEVDAPGDPGGLDLATRVDLSRVTAFRLKTREALEDREEDDEAEQAARHPDVEELFDGESVQRIAEHISGTETLGEASDLFFDLYLNAYSHVGEEDRAGLEKVVQTFVDAFFQLEAVIQVAIFEAAIAQRAEPEIEMFLGQFSSEEFAGLAAQVEDAVMPLLLEYASAVAEHVGADREIAFGGGESEVDDNRDAVASSVGHHLAEFLGADSWHSQAIERIQTEVGQLEHDPLEGPRLFAELLKVEGRPDRTARLLRVWASRSTRAIREKSFGVALSWLDVVASRTDLDARLVDEAYRQVVTDEVFELVTGEDIPGRAELLEALSARASDRLFDALAVEEDPGRRRALVDLVADIARVDLGSVVEGLADPRWYVVRNLATALGKSGRRAAGEPLVQLMKHEDHRVRIEATRALIPCLGNESVDYLMVALSDEHTRVRATAAELLKTFPDEAVVPALESGLKDESLGLEARLAIIKALGIRDGSEAQEILSRIAKSKTGLSSSARALRSAARSELRSPGV